jgi:hypothetical protein
MISDFFSNPLQPLALGLALSSHFRFKARSCPLSPAAVIGNEECGSLSSSGY